MLIPIDNTPRPYAWGSHGGISALRGRAATDALEAELWLGAHPESPARLEDGSGSDLREWIDEDPAARAGVEGHLVFLLKILAAREPLSLQVHPDPEQARLGFAREEEREIPRDAPERNYRDDRPKPEMLLALEDGFEGLCGFRSPQSVLRDLATVEDRRLAGFRDALSGDQGVESAVRWVLSGPGPTVAAAAQALQEHRTALRPRLASVLDRIVTVHPTDPTVLLALMLHHVELLRGQALYLPERSVHAYLHGIGIEIMQDSDNVLRAGLTAKHVDGEEVLRIADFSVSDPMIMDGRTQDGVTSYAPAGAAFSLSSIPPRSQVDIPVLGGAVILALGGGSVVEGRVSRTTLAPGAALYAAPDEECLTVSAGGTVIVGQAGRA